jgi:hypothetical protein
VSSFCRAGDHQARAAAGGVFYSCRMFAGVAVPPAGGVPLPRARRREASPAPGAACAVGGAQRGAEMPFPTRVVARPAAAAVNSFSASMRPAAYCAGSSRWAHTPRRRLVPVRAATRDAPPYRTCSYLFLARCCFPPVFFMRITVIIRKCTAAFDTFAYNKNAGYAVRSSQGRSTHRKKTG